MTAVAVPRRTLRRKEAALALGISRATIDRLIGRGELESIKRGRSRLIPVECVDAWLDRKKRGEA